MSNINHDEALKFYVNNLWENRDKLQVDSDKYLSPDFQIQNSKLSLLKTYRQQLRDDMNSTKLLIIIIVVI